MLMRNAFLLDVIERLRDGELVSLGMFFPGIAALLLRSSARRSVHDMRATLSRM